MKTITMVTVISGLLASSLALADPHTDSYLKDGGKDAITARVPERWKG